MHYVGEGKMSQEEGKHIPNFISELLKGLLYNAPVIDWTHRTLRSRPGDDHPARAITVKCHYFQERELLLKIAVMEKFTSLAR